MVLSVALRMVVGGLALFLAVACGSDGGSGGSGGGGGQAGSSGGQAGHAGSSGAPACDPNQPFGTPIPVAAANAEGSYRWCPRASATGLDLYFTGHVGSQADGDVFRIRRSSASEEFSGPWLALPFNTPAGDECAFETADGLSLFFNSDDDLKVSERASPGDPFITANVLAGGVNTSEPEQSPWLREDELWFVRWLPEAGSAEPIPRIFRSMRQGASEFGPGVQVDELHETAASEFTPVLSSDGLTLYFSRLVPGENLDIWVATRPAIGQAFDPPAKVAELSSDTSYEMLGWISADGCTAYLDSNREPPDWKVFVASRPKPR